MGSSYTNVQVSTRSRAPDDVRRALSTGGGPEGATAIVAALANPLGWLNDLAPHGFPPLPPRLREGCQLLRFRRARSTGPPPGPPRLAEISGSPGVRVRVGE